MTAEPNQAPLKEGTGGIVGRVMLLMGLAVLIGAGASLAAIGFVDLVERLNDLLLISPWARIQYEGEVVPLWLVTLLVPSAGGLVVGLVLSRASRERRPLGPPDAILAVQTRQPLPSLRDGLVSTGAAVVALGCGGSVGHYGPMVYLGAMLGGLASRLGLRLRDLSSIAIASGVAAAISTAFNAPITGLVFAHEVLLRHYAMQAFAPTTVAAATGYVMANVVFHRPALFLVDFPGVEHSYEFVLFAVLGILAALVAVLFMRLTLWTSVLATRTRLPQALRPALAGLAVGAVAIWLPDVLGIGRETLRFATIEGAFEPGEIVLILIAKIVLTALCIGFGFAGGVFSPALLIGILFGAASWMVLEGMSDLATSGLEPYAVAGMMAVTSSVIGAPLTTILIVFELTRSYDLTIAAMVSVVLASLISHRMFGRSLFDVQLARRGIDLSGGRDRARLATVKVAGFADRRFVTCRAEQRVVSIRSMFEQTGTGILVVVDGDGRFVGQIRPADLLQAADDAPVGSLAQRPPIVFDQETTLYEATQAMQRFAGEAVVVVDHRDGCPLGLVTERALMTAYLGTIHDLRREENEAA